MPVHDFSLIGFKASIEKYSTLNKSQSLTPPFLPHPNPPAQREPKIITQKFCNMASRSEIHVLLHQIQI